MIYLYFTGIILFIKVSNVFFSIPYFYANYTYGLTTITPYRINEGFEIQKLKPTAAPND